MKLIILGNCLQNTVGLVRSLCEQGTVVTLLIEQSFLKIFNKLSKSNESIICYI